MRDIATKSDGSTNLNAAEFNSSQVELENASTAGGETLDPGAGPDTFSSMLARSITRHGQAGISYQDTGSANAFVLGAVTAFVQPDAYFDGMTVSFVIANTNTGACTINVSSIGAVDLAQPGGTAFASGELVANNIVVARYFSGTNRFEVLVNTTPPAVGAASPDQYAVYDDTGDATGFTLGIEAGYVQPSSFTDAMTVVFKAAANNDGNGVHPATFGGLGSKNVLEADGSNPIANRIKAGDWVLMVFREVRDAFEIGFVYENPSKAAVVPATVSSSSGTLFNVDSVPEVRAPTEYINGMVLIFKAPQTNTGSVDVDLNSIGAVDLRTLTGGNFAAGEIAVNDLIIATYEVGGSEDRFRAFVAKKFIDLTRIRSAKSLGVLSGSVSNVSTEILDWAEPPAGKDPVSFYNPGNQNFAIPANLGIKKVDVTFFGDLSILTDESWSASIVVGGATEASGSVRKINNTSTNSSIVLHAQDVEVTDGTNFNVSVGLDAVAPRAFVKATFAIRVTEFEAS